MMTPAQHGPNEAASSQSAPFPAPHRLTVRVYYEDTDFSGVVYHASYLRFLERGRTEFLRALGIEHRGSFANGFHFVVRAMAIEFLKPALMDDVLSVATQLSATGGASIEMWQDIQRGDEIILTAKVRIAVVSGGKTRRIPAPVLAKLKAQTHSEPQPQAVIDTKVTRF